MRERDVDSEVAKKYDRVVERVTGSLEFLGIPLGIPPGEQVSAPRRGGLRYSPLT